MFQSPRSYTGEDLVEIHLPGSPVLAKMLLDELFRRGVRGAEAGEFTARAYFAGKLDLTEAEGVAATISASNEQELQAARQLLAGELARRLLPAVDLITHTLALVEVGIDFSEEDVTFLPKDEILRRVQEVETALARLLDESSRFERMVHEPRIVLAGRPNAGKSTLMNALSGQERSIVSNVAGTTRDVLSAPLDLTHGRVQLVDVAGLADTPWVTSEPGVAQASRPHSPMPDTGEPPVPRSGESSADVSIEHRMRERALQAVESAEHVVLVRDIADALPPIDLPRSPGLVVRTKSDLRAGHISAAASREMVVSAVKGNGLAELRDALDSLAFGREGSDAALALNRRHVAAIQEAREALSRVADRVSDGGGELIALELRESLDALGRVIGSVTPDDVLGKIFSSFCIGK